MGRNRCELAASLTVHEHVDVRADPPSLIENPAGHIRLASLELSEHVADGTALKLVLCCTGGQTLQWAPHTHASHAAYLSTRP
jgi:hypothetical protein